MRDLRVAAAAVQTIGDTIERSWIVRGTSGTGLRGGRFDYSSAGSEYRFRLDAERFVEDLAVSGTATWNTASGSITSHVSIVTDGGLRGRIDARWADRQPHAYATVTGTVGGRSVVATMPAP
jgi:hypothetical protein